MPALVVAGSGTDIGKTHVSAALLTALRKAGRPVEAFKPVASGVDEDDYAGSDPAVLLAALGRPVTRETVAAVSPLRYAAPLSPPLAARREGRALRFDEVAALCRARIAETPRDTLLLIETAGGAMSPVSDDATMLDLMAALGAPVLLVGGAYLGAISHTLTALACIRARGLAVAAVVVNEGLDAETEFEATFAALCRLAGEAELIPWRSGPAHESAMRLARRIDAIPR